MLYLYKETREALLLFSKGDKVVYPLYGAGVIVDLEDKLIDGQTSTYYVLSIPITNLKIMVAVNNAENIGMRPVFPSSELSEIIETSCDDNNVYNPNWNQRYRENMIRIKSGHLSETVGVFKSLRQREKAKGLSSAEKKMLTTARQIILSEIILSFNVEKEMAENILETAAEV